MAPADGAAPDAPVAGGVTRRFPELPKDHPLWSIELTRENGKHWLNNPFASDACLLVGGRYFFLHRPLVSDHSTYLQHLLDADSPSEARDFTLQLTGEVVEPDALAALLHWMYTGDSSSLHSDIVFSLIRVAQFLGMQEEFWQVLYTAITGMWVASGSAMWLDTFAKHVNRISLLHTLEILRRCDKTAVKVPPDIQLSLLLQAADAQISSDLKSDCQQLAKKIRQLVPLCAEQGLVTAAEKHSSFDVLVSSRELMGELKRRKELKRKAYHRQCSVCNLVFANEEEAAGAKCYKTVVKHSSDTFVSKAGNACCRRCSQPLHLSSFRCTERVEMSAHTLSSWLER
ncbi:unnamed protein product [Symbiodinium sp. CCMP2592]|nr:unnamed protein product [Symbiodinium sp. CCMP2592]